MTSIGFVLFGAMAMRIMWNLLIITRKEFATMKDPALEPVHPGEVLSEDFLKPLAVSQYRLAKDIGVPPRRINEIILGKRGITADTALRLAHYLGTSPAVWMNLQTRYELDRKSLVLSKLIARLPRLAATLA
jgi:addiction module HigA family antidote